MEQTTVGLFHDCGADQIGNYTGAAALLNSLAAAQRMLGDRSYNPAWFKDASENQPNAIRVKITRNRIKIMFGRLEKLAAGLNPL